METFLSLALLLVLSAAAFAAAPSDDVKRLATDNNRFACDLYGQLRGTDSENLFFSPYSLSTALGMTLAGARGETEKQMAATLHFDLPQAQLHPAFKGLAESLKAGAAKKAYELSIANALWGQKGYDFKKPFLDLTAANYGAGLKQVDFKAATEESRQTINAWVEKETKDKIKDLLQPGILTDQTRLVLTNAIYFQGSWLYPFKAANTKEEPFILARHEGPVSARATVIVPLMFHQDDFRYLANDTMQVLELPYRTEAKDGQGLSMQVFLPKKNTFEDLAAIEKSLTAEAIQKWTAALQTREVLVYLPKFQMACEFSLADKLKALGMTDAFGSQADFSGLSSEGLSLSAVVHKAFLDVNEEGTEAAAATAIPAAAWRFVVPG